MKITDIKIDVIRREIPDTGLDSDLGRFAGTVEQGLLRIHTDEGIEGNCYIGAFRGGGHSHFGPILNVLKPELPVYKLLGTQRYHTEVYGTYPPRHESPEGYVEEAREMVARGFRAYKIHPGMLSTPDVIRMVTMVREAVGPAVRLMLDPN